MMFLHAVPDDGGPDATTDDQDGVTGDASTVQENSEDAAPTERDPVIVSGDDPEIAAHHAALYAKFDPNIHATNEDGTPKLTPKGRLAKKRGRDKAAGSFNAAASVSRPGSANGISGAPSTGTDAPIPINPAVYKAAGQAAATITIGSCTMLLGPAWHLDPRKPEEADEYKTMSGAYADYFKATGITDISPGWILALVLTGYAMPRFQDPVTLSRFQRIGLALRNVWQRIRPKKG